MADMTQPARTAASRGAFAKLAACALPVLPVIALAAAWEIFARSGAVTMFVLPPLSAVLARIYTDAASGDLAINVGVTLYRALTGFVIAGVGGVVLGMAMCRNALARWFFDPIVSIGFP